MSVTSAEDESCYGPGSIALAVILTIFITLISIYILYKIWRLWKQKKDKHLVLETDPEKGKNPYAFDNDGFTDAATPYNQTLDNSNKLNSVKSKWSQWSPISTLLNKNEKQKSMDDSAIQADEIKTVLLKSHDFTGLGFNICGNMRDGIFIKDILHRGPAFESGRLNPGDRIKSVTINFEHVVYEDALTILSYASPYEVIMKAQSGKMNVLQTPSKYQHLGHPLYRSSSSSDLVEVRKKTPTPALFPGEFITRRATSPPPSLNTSAELETQFLSSSIPSLNTSTSIEYKEKSENKHPKFGIKVFPVGIETVKNVQQSLKSNESAQNNNNVNLEKLAETIVVTPKISDENHSTATLKVQEKPVEVTLGIDEVDNTASFLRNNLNDSGIKRDKDGIPQEIPNHMLNAAVVAKRNRKASEQEDVKSSKKQKGRAPEPPKATPNTSDEKTNYESDSDLEPDTQRSLNNIELNSNDITIHQTEEIDDMQNRKTASTGDLTKVHKSRKTSTGTLERAQSLDITDTVLPSFSTKMVIETKLDSEESLSEQKSDLEGLNTFQRIRLKKSTDWGNLEDAILSIQPEVENIENEVHSLVSDEEIKPSLHSEDNCRTEGQNVWSITTKSDDTEFSILPHDQIKPVSPVLSKLELGPEKSAEFLIAERSISGWDPYYNTDRTTYGINVSDDVKVSRHSYTSLNDSNGNISNIMINSSEDPSEINLNSNEFYLTCSDETLMNESAISSNENSDRVTIEGPTSLTLQINDAISSKSSLTESPKSNYSLTYITEIHVPTPNNSTTDTNDVKTIPLDIKLDVEKELHKIQEIADEQLKKLPEMRFSTSSYESPKTESYTSQIEQLRSNFEKSPSKTSLKLDTSNASKSRIPVATVNKTPPTSPERRDSRNFDLEVDKDIITIMSSPIHSTPISNLKYQHKSPNRNVSVTSIRNSSKIPSGLPSRPTIPPRRFDLKHSDSLERISTNGSSFKQWVFNPGDNTVTNITVSEGKLERK